MHPTVPTFWRRQRPWRERASCDPQNSLTAGGFACCLVRQDGIDAFCAVGTENRQLKFISLLDTVRPLLFDNSARLLQKSRAASDSLFYRGAAFREAIVQKERNAQMTQVV